MENYEKSVFAYFECSEVEDVKQLLSSFRFITVRENSAVEALKEIGIDNSIHILDPTLLLTKKDWIENLKLKETESDYILFATSWIKLGQVTYYS